MGVIGAAADEALVGLELGDALGVHPGDDLLHLGHDFRADAVAGEIEDVVGCHGCSRERVGFAG
jgi:hypothetical protein